MMKKTKWLALVVAMVFLFTGCGKKLSDAEIIDNAGKQMKELSNYAMTMDIQMGIKSSGLEMSIPFTIDLELDNQSKLGYMKLVAEILGISITSESYMDASTNPNVTYTKEVMADTWTKKYSEDADEFDDIVSITENSENIEKKESNDKNILYYQVTITKEKMQELLNESMSTVESDTETYTIDGDVIVDLYIDKKTNYITKMEMDLLDVISFDEEDTELTAFTMSITFSKFNEIDKITIPDEVIENAVEEQEEYDDTDIESSGIDYELEV